MKRLIITSIFILFSFSAFAICKGSMINPITEVRWTCMLPVTFAGIKTATLPMPEAASAMLADLSISGSVSPACACLDTVPPKVGLTFGINNVFRLAESTKDAFCFPGIGMDLSNAAKAAWGTAGQDQGKKDSAQTTFTYTHLFSFIPTALLSAFIDVLCLQISETPLSLAYMSEFMPQAKSSELALILAPETILFANPIAQAYCMVDSMLTIVELTDPIGYWCVGGHSIFPLSNHSVEVEYVDAASINIAKILFTQVRSAVLPICIGSQAVCGCYPFPIWNKMEYRFQIAKPIPDIFCRRMGKPSLMWNTPTKNPAMTVSEDNLAFLIWRRRDCCAF